MPCNIEIKAHIVSVEALLPITAAIAGQQPIHITQDDTFFNCGNGRLKLRAFGDGQAELIFYRRPDQQGPKESFYVRSPVSEPDSLREALGLAYGQSGRVQKQRLLFITGRTRIHLDRVHYLGDFLELEVVLAEGESAADGVQEAHALMAKLGVGAADLIDTAYVDMLEHNESDSSH